MIVVTPLSLAFYYNFKMFSDKFENQVYNQLDNLVFDVEKNVQIHIRNKIELARVLSGNSIIKKVQAYHINSDENEKIQKEINSIQKNFIDENLNAS